MYMPKPEAEPTPEPTAAPPAPPAPPVSARVLLARALKAQPQWVVLLLLRQQRRLQMLKQQEAALQNEVDDLSGLLAARPRRSPARAAAPARTADATSELDEWKRTEALALQLDLLNWLLGESPSCSRAAFWRALPRGIARYFWVNSPTF